MKRRGGQRKEITWSVDEASGCWNCTSHMPDSYGYPRTVIVGKHKKIMRFMYEKYKGEIPSGLLVRHTCDNRNCINPDHLITGTIADNIKDMIDRKRHYCQKKGIQVFNGGNIYKNQRRNNRAGNMTRKLTNEQAKEIKLSDKPRKVLSALFGVTDGTIYAIQSGRHFKNL